MSSRNGPPRVLVIGGGVSGLAAACRLAVRGVNVLLVERQQEVGGMTFRHEWENYSWELDNHLITQPNLLQDYWSLLGEDPEQDLQLCSQQMFARCFWENGRELDVENSFWRRAELAHLVKQAEAWAKSNIPGNENQPSKKNLLSFVPTREHFSKSVGLASESIADPQLAQLVRFLATPRGSHPWKTPVSLLYRSIVNASQGYWYPKQGSSFLSKKLKEIADKLHVEIKTSCEVQLVHRSRSAYKVDVRDLKKDTQQTLDCNGVVCAMDANYGRHVLWKRKRSEKSTSLDVSSLSLSSFTVFLALQKQFSELSSRNFFFGDPEQDFAVAEGLFSQQNLAQPSQMEVVVFPGQEQEEDTKESWVVNTPAPLISPQISWESRSQSWSQKLISSLENQFGIAGLASSICYSKSLSPLSYAQYFQLPLGSTHGLNYHGAHGTTRIKNQTRFLPHFAYAGRSAYPQGQSVATRIQSGSLAAETLLRSFQLPL